MIPILENVTTTTIPLYQQLFELVTSDPKVAFAVIVQILMGIALGYYMAKVIKYFLALIGVIIIGVILNVWSLGGSIEDALTNLGIQALELKDVVFNFLSMLGVLTVGPITLGFVIGLIIASSRK